MEASAHSAVRTNRPSAILGWVGGVVLGIVLLVAAWAKAIDPAAFAEQIAGEGLTFGLPAAALALAGVAIEIFLGLALLLNLRRPALLVAVGALVLFFLFLTGRTYWRAEHGIAPPAAGCGCFGNLIERTPAEAFWQDLLLLLPTAALAWIGRPRPTRGARLRWLATGAVTAGAAAFTWAAPGLPLDDLATRLKPGVGLAELCAGAGDARVCLADLTPELVRGRHWVVLVDARHDGFGEVAATLNRYTLAGGEPPVTALADLTAEEQNALFWRFAPAFDLHETPAAMLRPLYRTLPRSFLVDEGRVVRTAPGLAAELSRTNDPAS